MKEAEALYKQVTIVDSQLWMQIGFRFFLERTSESSARSPRIIDQFGCLQMRQKLAVTMANRTRAFLRTTLPSVRWQHTEYVIPGSRSSVKYTGGFLGGTYAQGCRLFSFRRSSEVWIISRAKMTFGSRDFHTRLGESSLFLNEWYFRRGQFQPSGIFGSCDFHNRLGWFTLKFWARALKALWRRWC